MPDFALERVLLEYASLPDRIGIIAGINPFCEADLVLAVQAVESIRNHMTAPVLPDPHGATR